MDEKYDECTIDGKAVFRSDRRSEYGFLYSHVTGDLCLCPPALSGFVRQTVQERRDVSSLLKMITNLREPDDSSVPSLHQIVIYATQRCNLACSHCWIKAVPNGQQLDVPLGQIVSVVDQAIRLGLKTIQVSGGEPLTWGPLTDLLRALSGKGPPVSIDTNGTLMHRDMAARLADLNATVAISIDSHIEVVHDRLRGEGAFRKTLRCIGLMDEFNVPYEVNSCVYQENCSDLEAFFEWCHKMGVRKLKLNVTLPWGRGLDLSRQGALLDVERLIAMAELIQRTSAPSVRPELPYSLFPLEFIYHRMSTGHCNLTRILSILPDGRLSVCGPGYGQKTWGSLGCLGDDLDLGQLWRTHPSLLRLRRDIPDRLTGVCAKCVFSKICFGFCRVDAHSAAGSLTAPYPLCEHLYESGRFPEIYLLNGFHTGVDPAPRNPQPAKGDDR